MALAGGFAGALGPLPRITPGLVVPLLAGVGAYRWYPDVRAVVLAAPLHWLVGVQAFRLAALSFVALAATGLGPGGLIVVGMRTRPRRRRCQSPRLVVPLLFTAYAFADLLNGVVQIAFVGRTTVPTTELFQQFPFAYIGSVTTPLSFLLMGFVLVRLARAHRGVEASPAVAIVG